MELRGGEVGLEKHTKTKKTKKKKEKKKKNLMAYVKEAKGESVN